MCQRVSNYCQNFQDAVIMSFQWDIPESIDEQKITVPLDFNDFPGYNSYTQCLSNEQISQLVINPEHNSLATINMNPAAWEWRKSADPSNQANLQTSQLQFNATQNEALASAGEDEVILWDTATGERLHRLTSYSYHITIAFSPDGKQLASAGKDELTLWDAVNPMGQVRDAFSYVGGGQHTVNIDVHWHLRDFVQDGLDRTQDLASVLTITGDPDEAYGCSCEDYVNFAWRENAGICRILPSFHRIQVYFFGRSV
jgi:WD40 repeat protein